MWKAKEEFVVILTQTLQMLSEVSDNLCKPYEDLDYLSRIANKESLKARLELDLARMAEAVRYIEEYKQWFKNISLEYKDSILEEEERLKKENSELRETVRQLAKRIETLEREKEFKEKEELNRTVRQLEELNERHERQIECLFRIIDGQINNIALKEYMKSDEFKSRDRIGDKAPRYRRDIDKEEIIELYQKGWTIKQLAEKFNCSYNTISSRLKSAK